jgi:hypothetical protein
LDLAAGLRVVGDLDRHDLVGPEDLDPLAADLELPGGDAHSNPTGMVAYRTPGGQVVAVQFPCGSVLAESGNSVDIPGVGTLHLDDSFSGGGGDGDLSDLGGVPAECQVGTSRIYWQSGDAVGPQTSSHKPTLDR